MPHVVGIVLSVGVVLFAKTRGTLLRGPGKNEYNVESTLLTVARTGHYTSGLRRGFTIAPSIGLSLQF